MFDHLIYEVDRIGFGQYVFNSLSLKGTGVYVLTARFTASYIKDIYQFEFGVLDVSTDVIDVSAKLNNCDKNHILATVAYIMFLFSKEEPSALIRFSGSTASRTRLFSIWIVNHWDTMNQYFIIYGCSEHNKWERYVKTNSNRYVAIILKNKI